MSVFDIISLLGGLAMFLYGMRLMGDSLKQGASGALKVIMGKVTNNPIKAFLLGVFVTAVIQSSTATIVITSGLVAAGVISLHQSLGIIIGANVGTTVTGQIIRLLDVGDSGTSFLNIFKPSTLAPLALIAGIILIMFCNFKKSNVIGSILMGFGILFSGLLNMTSAVNSLSESGMLDNAFALIGDNMWLGYLIGAGIAFLLQSSSATIGILQAFALASGIPFKAVYVILVGIYLGDCVTTAIVCSIGAKADSKRVGLVNILFNLSETVLVLLVVTILHSLGVLNGIWDANMTPGTIANTNTIFNLGCALLLLPMVSLYEKAACRIIKDKEKKTKYDEQLAALSPAFFKTPAIAFNSCFEVLKTMLSLAQLSVRKSVRILFEYEQKEYDYIETTEDDIDMLTDHVGSYLVELSPSIKEDLHIAIMNEYNTLVTEFERLGDHAMNIAEIARTMNDTDVAFSEYADREMKVLMELIDEIFEYTTQAFEKRSEEAARHIEPLEEVVDDMIGSMKNNHLERLRTGICSINGGIYLMDILVNMERISDICSNIGIATIARIHPEIASLAHNYVSSVHGGSDENFVIEYNEAHDKYFEKLAQAEGAQ